MQQKKLIFPKANLRNGCFHSRTYRSRQLLQNDCLYCGIRKSNVNAERYVLTEEQILDCCREGYALGFRTFVLQGGEGMLPVGKSAAQ